MPPPDESVSEYETILLNSFEQDDTDIAGNGGSDELNTGVTYFMDEEGRYYYRKDIQNVVSLPIEQELQKNREEAQILVEEDGYQTFTLTPSDNVEDEMRYVLIIQDGNDPVMKTDGNIENIEENITNVYTVQEKEAESIDKEADNLEERSKYTVVSKENTHTRPHFACNFCSYTNKKRYLLLRHLKKHSAERPYKCIVCDRGFKTLTALQNHVNMHQGIKRHVCKHCNNTFTTSGELVRHMRYRHTHEKPHKCTECDYASVELSKLKRHVRSHTGERPFQCPHCTYASRDTFKLKRHMRTHTGEKPYKCEFCRGSFTQSSSLKLHLLIHNESEKPTFPCGLCPTKCGTKKDLQNHVQKQHTSEKPLRCNKCGKYFSDRYTCKIHNKTHVGEKCFKCEMCSYASTRLRSLHSHTFKHTNEKPFNCEQCDHSFKQKQLLQRHENRYHNSNYESAPPKEKSHTCNNCSRMFANKGNLIRHLATHDPDSGERASELAPNLNTESQIKVLGDNINTDDSVQTVAIIGLNLESEQLEGGKVLTVADVSGQQYLVLEVMDLENGADQQINIIPPEEFLNEKGKDQEEINKEKISEEMKLDNVNKMVERDIDTCFGFDEDYGPDGNFLRENVVEKEVATMTLY